MRYRSHYRVVISEKIFMTVLYTTIMGLRNKIGSAFSDAYKLMTKGKRELLWGLLISVPATTCAIQHERKDNLYTETGFSEIHQLEAIAEREGEDLDALAWYYAANFDFDGKIFEARNDPSMFPRLPDNQRRHFARKLEQAMDSTLKIFNYSITSLATRIPDSARAALKELNDMQQVRIGVQRAQDALEKSWDHTSHESGHFEPYQDCHSVCDIEGNCQMECTTELRYKCDYVDHTWHWHPHEGARAIRELRNTKEAFPEIQYIDMPLPKEIGAENEQRIREGIRVKTGEIGPSSDEVSRRAELYKYGSTYETHIHNIRSTWDYLSNKGLSDWQDVSENAKTTHDRDHLCGSGSPPPGYNLRNILLSSTKNLNNRSGRILTSIHNSIQAVPQLVNDIMEFYVAETGLPHHYNSTNVDTAHFVPPDTSNLRSAKKLEKSIFKDAQEHYGDNFPQGLPVDNFSELLIALIGIGTFAGGTSLGALHDYFQERRKWR